MSLSMDCFVLSKSSLLQCYFSHFDNEIFLHIDGSSSLSSRTRIIFTSGLGTALLTFQSFFIKAGKEPKSDLVDSSQKLQDFHIGGFGMGLGTPQKIIAWRITFCHLSTLWVFHSH